KKIKRKSLLFNDDRQVEVLIVNHHIEARHNKPSIQIEVMRYSNFIKDLKLIKQIQRNDFNCDAEKPYFDMDELLEKHNDKIFTNWEQSLETYYDMKDFYKRSEEHTSELQSRFDIVCRLLLEKKNSTES